MNKKIVGTLLLSQSLLSAALILSFTVGSIMAVELAGGNKAVTGLPGTVGMLGSAAIAAPIGILMDRTGRRLGLTLGHVFGLVGTLIAGVAVIQGSLMLFLGGIFGLGLARGAVEMGRYAAAEASPAAQRARAISLVVMGGTVGSIGGPSLLALAESVSGWTGLPADAGPWLVAGSLFVVGIVLITVFLYPDPQTLGRDLAKVQPEVGAGEARSFWKVFEDPRTKLAMVALVFGQIAMVVVMTITPVHMTDHAHELGAVSLVIMAHTLGMFGFSFFTGWLTDRLGRMAVIFLGGVQLIVACVLAPFSVETPWLAMALFLLGLGWNFCFVAGSTLLDDVLRLTEKGRIQGIVDTTVKLASGTGTLLSGVVFAAIGYSWTSWATIAVSLLPVVVVLLLRTRIMAQPHEATAAA